jgi:dienelactone hydrolase
MNWSNSTALRIFLDNSSSVVQSSAARWPCRLVVPSKAILQSPMERGRSLQSSTFTVVVDWGKPLARFSDLLTGWGYVSLAVDSLATRGIKEACDRPMPDRQADAWGALQYLSKLTFVDRERIAVLGSSQGGNVALQLASTHDVKLFDIPDGLSFKAAVALYPLCGIASEQLAMPTIVMIGELDDWSPAKSCEQWLAQRNEGGAPVKLVVYPGAYHNFDVPGAADGMRFFGHWLKYDPEAARKSTTKMHDFLAAQLSK